LKLTPEKIASLRDGLLMIAEGTLFGFWWQINAARGELAVSLH
jgi:hypothetical protein